MDTVAAFVKDVYDKIPKQVKYVAGAAAAGAAAIPLTVLSTAAAIPWAMSTFGTVVPGVGKMHAAGGVAGTLQRSSAIYADKWYMAGVFAGAFSSVFVILQIFNDDAKQEGEGGDLFFSRFEQCEKERGSAETKRETKRQRRNTV